MDRKIIASELYKIAKELKASNYASANWDCKIDFNKNGYVLLDCVKVYDFEKKYIGSTDYDRLLKRIEKQESNWLSFFKNGLKNSKTITISDFDTYINLSKGVLEDRMLVSVYYPNDNEEYRNELLNFLKNNGFKVSR